jgi:hypothetical protein
VAPLNQPIRSKAGLEKKFQMKVNFQKLSGTETDFKLLATGTTEQNFIMISL